MFLEREIIGIIHTTETALRIRGIGKRRRWYGTEIRLRLSHILCTIEMSNSVCIDRVKPAALPFSGIDIELDRDIFSKVNSKFADTIFSENREAHVARIVTTALNFYHIILRNPSISGFRSSGTFFLYFGY